jgi:hypothetical protein
LSPVEDAPPPLAESPRKTSAKHLVSKHAPDDDEIQIWAQRLQAIQAKARTLDSNIQESVMSISVCTSGHQRENWIHIQL